MVDLAEPPPHVVRVPRWVLAIHAVQFVFAIVILGLDAYGIRWIAYNALIFSLVVCICTLGVCAYLLASQLSLYQIYNMYIALALHLWMLLFWVIDLGLVANLAKLWSGDYSYGYYYGSYYYSYAKRDLHSLYRREETTYEAYYGALAAGAVFAAVQFVSWIAVTVILFIHVSKHRQNGANPTTHVTQPPPQYTNNNGPAVPMEKYGQVNVQTQAQPTPQQQYAQPAQQHYAQQQQGPYAQQPQHIAVPYPQDPVPRQDTVSPVSQAGYGYAPQSNVSELSSPQHTGAYPPNASELSTPQHTGAYNPDLPELSNQR